MSGAIRRAPSHGYDFGAKREYRRNLWTCFRDRLEIPAREAHALLMPSVEGDEIDMALSKGFQQRHLHVVDRNPAIVATLKRRYPEINTYGVDLVRACERIKRAGVELSVANFDFTSCVSAPLLMDCVKINEVYPFADHALLAVTLLRGREMPEITALLRASEEKLILAPCVVGNKAPQPRDTARMAVVFASLARDWAHWNPIRTAVYTSGTQTMLWAAIELTGVARWEAICNDVIDRHRAAVALLESATQELKDKTALLRAGRVKGRAVDRAKDRVLACLKACDKIKAERERAVGAHLSAYYNLQFEEAFA